MHIKHQKIGIDQVELSPYRNGRVLPSIAPGMIENASDARQSLPPAGCRRKGKNVYELLYNHKAWLLAQRLGYANLDVIVHEGLSNDDAKAMVELDLVQGGVSPHGIAERARDAVETKRRGAIRRVAEEVGKGESTVRHYKRLLSLDPRVRRMWEKNRIDIGDAKAIASLPRDVQYALAKRVIEENLSVREVEKIAKKIRGGGESTKPQAGSPATNLGMNKSPATADPDTAHLEQKLSERFGCRVQLVSGNLVFAYGDNLEILDGVLEKMGYAAE